MADRQAHIELVFQPDDRVWMRQARIAVPDFWPAGAAAPLVGDVLRFGGRQFTIQARVWEQEGGATRLRLYLGDAHALGDTRFGTLA